MQNMKINDKNQEWIGNIPKNWTFKKIKYVLAQRNEKNIPIKSKDILSLTAKQGVIPYTEKEGGGNKPKTDFSAYKLAYPGDIVMNSMNILSGAVGLSKYFGCVSPVYYMLYCSNDEDDIRYFYYVFANKAFQSSLLGIGNGILMKESENGTFNTIRMRIPIEKLNNMSIPYPKPEIQKAIANFLDKKIGKIDEVSKKIQQEITDLEEYRRSLIIQAVTKGLDKNINVKHTEIPYLNNINKNWFITKIGYICTKLQRPIITNAMPLVCSNHGHVIPRPKTMVGKMVSEDNAMQGIKKGDIAIHGMDTWHGAIALSHLNGKITRVVHVCESSQDNRFIVYYLQALAYLGVYKLISYGVRGNTSDFRSWEKVKNIYIPIPTKKEQLIICNYLDKKSNNIESIIQKKQKLLNYLDKYKQSIIYEYVTGKKQVSSKESAKA